MPREETLLFGIKGLPGLELGWALHPWLLFHAQFPAALSWVCAKPMRGPSEHFN